MSLLWVSISEQQKLKLGHVSQGHLLETNGIKYEKLVCKLSKTGQIVKALDKRPRAKPHGLQEDFLLSTSVLVAQLCLTLCDLIDCSLPGSSVHGILQERKLEWVAIPFYRGSSRPRNRTRVSCMCRQILYHLSHYKCDDRGQSR